MSFYNDNSRDKIGDITAKVLENSQIPILFVKPDTILTIENNIWNPKKILVPLNGTPSSAQIFHPLIRILDKSKVLLHLLHVFTAESDIPSEPGTLSAPFYEDYPRHEWCLWKKEFLKRFCLCPIVHNHINYKFSVLTGTPEEKIIEYVKDNNNDLIAMAWQGNLAEPHANILKKVLIESPCSILISKIAHKSLQCKCCQLR